MDNDKKWDEGIVGAYGIDSLYGNVKKFSFKDDKVNSPAHYTRGKREAIDVIEDAIYDAPDAVVGMLQGQVLKYLLRMWLKDNPRQDAEKAQWYLNRLVDNLNCHD